MHTHPIDQSTLAAAQESYCAARENILRAICLVTSWLRIRQERDDLRQAAELYAWRAWASCCARGLRPERWSYRIGRHAALEVLRKRHAEYLRKDPAGPFGDRPGTGAPRLAGLSEDALALARRGAAQVVDDREQLATWLSALTPRLQRAARLLGVGHTRASVAAHMGVSIGRLKQLRHDLAASWIVWQTSE